MDESDTTAPASEEVLAPPAAPVAETIEKETAEQRARWEVLTTALLEWQTKEDAPKAHDEKGEAARKAEIMRTAGRVSAVAKDVMVDQRTLHIAVPAAIHALWTRYDTLCGGFVQNVQQRAYHALGGKLKDDDPAPEGAKEEGNA